MLIPGAAGAQALCQVPPAQGTPTPTQTGPDDAPVEERSLSELCSHVIRPIASWFPYSKPRLETARTHASPSQASSVVPSARLRRSAQTTQSSDLPSQTSSLPSTSLRRMSSYNLSQGWSRFFCTSADFPHRLSSPAASAGQSLPDAEIHPADLFADISEPTQVRKTVYAWLEDITVCEDNHFTVGSTSYPFRKMVPKPFYAAMRSLALSQGWALEALHQGVLCMQARHTWA